MFMQAQILAETNEVEAAETAGTGRAREVTTVKQDDGEGGGPAQGQFLHIGQELAKTIPPVSQRKCVIREQEYFEDLLDTVQAEARKLRQSQRGTRLMVAAFVGVMALMTTLYIARALHSGSYDPGNWFSYFGIFFSFGGVAAASKTHKKAASELTAIDDLRAVGPLAESLAIEDKRVRAQVQAALIRLLPRLQSSDAALLTPNSRASLNRALNGTNETLTLAILKAYEQVGDEAALPFVERLAAQGTNGKRTRHTSSARVADAAQGCLGYLRVRVEYQQAGKTLLRGASALDIAPDTLLRPAQETASDPAYLLRADARPQQPTNGDTTVLTR